MNILYRNKKWLRYKYKDEKLSTRKIGKLCNVTHATIIETMKKYNIPRRSNSEGIHLARGNHCNLSQEAIYWMNGELLGDGCLQSCSIYTACFQYGSKYKEYIEYVKDKLEYYGIKGKTHKVKNKRSRDYCYAYYSKSYPELLPIRKQWYPEGKKIVPKDILLTPLVCRQWYIGDGSLSLIRKRNPNPRIRLATCGFTILDVKWLVEQLNKLKFKTTRQPQKNTVSISTYSTKEFLEYIGECPVNCYKYKWA